MATEEIVTRTGRTWVDEANGVLRFKAFPKAEQSLDDAKANMDAVVQLMKKTGKRYPMMVDLSESKALGPEARDYYGRPESRSNYRALAIVGTSPLGKMLGNIWLAVYGDRDVPSKLFTSEPDAIEWLKGFRE